MEKTLHVTSPLMPALDDMLPNLRDIWKRKWLTNNGHYHHLLEQQLVQHLRVDHLSLFSNGTLALITALQALHIGGEVITTPYSFVATSQALSWNNIVPVFVDIDPQTFNINPDKIEAAITEKTTAILATHVYGYPCNHERLKVIAQRHSLKLIYDAAQAFGTEMNGRSIVNWGDISILSFHATKPFSTIEGGAVICHDTAMKRHIDDLKNFGFRDELTVVCNGINGKMNEVQAAYGLSALDYIDSALIRRREASDYYRLLLKEVSGVQYRKPEASIAYNNAYFPILIDEATYGESRDNLYERLKQNNIFGRRYFYPLIPDLEAYRANGLCRCHDLTYARDIASRVICLPMHHELEKPDIDRVVNVISRK